MKTEEPQPGRELDAFVAEKVMGWQKFSNEANASGADRPWFTIESFGVCVRRSGRPGIVSRSWSPSTDRGAAEEVEKQLNREGWMVIVINHHDGNLAACMIADGIAASHGPQDTFLHLHEYEGLHAQYPGIFGKPVRVSAGTASHAICLAAYKLHLKTHE